MVKTGRKTMTEQDFFYWLQGYFELADVDASIDARMSKCIVQHIELVHGCQELTGGKTPPPLTAEAGYRLGRVAGILQIPDEQTRTDCLREQVARVFEHVIDPEAGPAEVQEKLDAVHQGRIGGKTPGGSSYRC